MKNQKQLLQSQDFIIFTRMKQNGISSLKKGGFGEFYPFGMLLYGRNSQEERKK
jgi:hypothetical protein